jgi:hypothetical protein
MEKAFVDRPSSPEQSLQERGQHVAEAFKVSLHLLIERPMSVACE